MNRDVLGNISASSPISYTALEPILPQLTVERLEEDCINIVRVRHSVGHLAIVVTITITIGLESKFNLTNDS